LTIRSLGDGPPRRLTGLPGTLLAASFAADGRSVFSAAACEDGQAPLRRHDLDSGRVTRTEGKGPIRAVAANREGHFLVGREGDIHVERLPP
jgi:hypothetical protein